MRSQYPACMCAYVRKVLSPIYMSYLRDHVRRAVLAATPISSRETARIYLEIQVAETRVCFRVTGKVAPRI
jgi:hypothetical protein